MKYICLVYQDESKLAAVSDADLAATLNECGAWVEELERGGHHVFSSGLQSVRTAVTLRTREGKLSVTDGPFAETKEVLGGFTILIARDLNEAIQLASRFPGSRFGSVEVRPVLEPGAEVSELSDRRVVEAVSLAKGGALSQKVSHGHSL